MRKAIQEKSKNIESLKDTVKKYSVYGLLDLKDLPSKQFNEIKKKLSDDAKIVVCKKIILTKCFEQLEKEIPGISKLNEKIPKTIPALILSNVDSFKLMKKIRQNLSPAFAKPGQISTEDITIKKGPTPFAPGPVLSEFGRIGVKAKVEQGKITIIKDTVVAKEGEEISEDVAGMLSKLGIQPMRVGLNLIASYEEGTIFDKDVLIIDEEEFMKNLSLASSQAFNLAMNSDIVNIETVPHFLQKAFSEARALAIDRDIVSKETIENILSKANNQAFVLKKQIKEE